MRRDIVMAKLLILNALRAPVRVPLKWAIFALVALAVCFPHPSILSRHLKHWRNPNALIEPDAPALQPLVAALRPQVGPDLPPAEALKTVERFVHRRVPYAWDWETWGTADYMPTVTETLDMGREDCDGRAVVAASLLKELGFDARIVTDFAHVWVQTDKGDTMGPGKRKAIVSKDDGFEVRFAALAELPRAFAYGMAVFPLVRELIIAVVLWYLLIRPGHGAAKVVVVAGLLLGGLFALRAGGAAYGHPVLWLQWLGLAAWLGMWIAWAIPVKRLRQDCA
jgi:uncharacterized membrane protein